MTGAVGDDVLEEIVCSIGGVGVGVEVWESSGTAEGNSVRISTCFFDGEPATLAEASRRVW